MIEMMKSVPTLDFGEFIAYLVPGFVAFYAISYVSPTVADILSNSFEEKGGIGTELAILLFSIAAGVVVSAFRVMFLDALHQKFGVNRPNFKLENLNDENTLAAYETAIRNTYRFAQFYGNMLVATSLFAILKVYTQNCIFCTWQTMVLIAICLVVLGVAHRNQLRQTYEALSKILGVNE